MRSFRLLHLVIDDLQVLIELFDTSFEIKRLLEDLLTIWRRIIHVRVAHHLLEEPIVLLVLLVMLAHLLRQYRVELIFNRAQFAQECALLQLNIVQLLQVSLVCLFDLASLSFYLFDFCKRFDQHKLVVA